MRTILLTVAFALLTALPAVADEPVDAVWKEQKVDFRIVGSQTAYSCDSIKAKITTLLRHVGAHDIEVTAPSCRGFNEPQWSHRILARFSTLVSAGEGDVDVVKAVWSEVELGKRSPRSIDNRDCELLEYFQKYLLVEIEYEVIDGQAVCGAARRSIAGRLKLRVLEPVTEDDRAKKDG